MAATDFKLALGLSLIALIIIGVAQEADALPKPTWMVSCAKDYMVNLVRDKVISRSALVGSFNETMAVVKERYNAALTGGQLEGKDETEKSSFYYKLVIEELRGLRERIESGESSGNGPTIGQQVTDNSEEQSAEDKLMGSCFDVASNVDEQQQQQQKYSKPWSPNDPENDADEEELSLLSELDDLERMAAREDEMGWSLTPESHEALKARTRVVLAGLLNNEVRQLAMSILSAYMTGGALQPAISVLGSSIMYKVIEFMMHGVLDVVASVLGQTAEPKALIASIQTTNNAVAPRPQYDATDFMNSVRLEQAASAST